jgi:ribosomal protein S18 acetylase RimI-like enzyme
VRTIRPLEPRDADACDAIVVGLPYHFGLEEGRRECAAAVRSQDGFVAVADEHVVGFLTFHRHFDDCAEITWMATEAARRRQGIGRSLMDRLSDALLDEGRRFLILLTVSPSDDAEEPPDGYGATRAFYSAQGFAPIREFEGLWSSNIPVLIARYLGE